MIERRTITDGSARWKVRIKSGGEIVAQQTFRLKGDAETWQREQMRALQLGTFLPPQQARVPLGQVVAKFLEARTAQVTPHSQRTDRDNLAALPPKLRARPIGSINEVDVLGFLTDQLKIKERSTVSRMRTSLSALFTYAQREKYVAVHPVRSVKLPSGARQKPADEWFTAESLTATLAAQRMFSRHYATITEWSSLTGLRWSETRALRVSDLQDLPFPAVWVRRAHSEGYEEKAPKTDNGTRVVPLTDRAREIARAAAAGKPLHAYLITSPTGRQVHTNPYRKLTRWSVTARAGQLCEE